jgi:hypothetical protein
MSWYWTPSEVDLGVLRRHWLCSRSSSGTGCSEGLCRIIYESVVLLGGPTNTEFSPVMPHGTPVRSIRYSHFLRFPWPFLQLFRVESTSEQQESGCYGMGDHWECGSFRCLALFWKSSTLNQPNSNALSVWFIPSTSHPPPTFLLSSPLPTTLYQHTRNASNGPAADVVVCERHFLHIRSIFGRKTPVY